jgi:hypothetical protein
LPNEEQDTGDVVKTAEESFQFFSYTSNDLLTMRPRVLHSEWREKPLSINNIAQNLCSVDATLRFPRAPTFSESFT